MDERGRGRGLSLPVYYSGDHKVSPLELPEQFVDKRTVSDKWKTVRKNPTVYDDEPAF